MLLAFLVVFFVLAKFGFPAIIGMVEKRKKYIDESLSKAQKAAAQLENIKQESESMLQEARGKQAAILKAEAEKESAILKADGEAQAIRAVQKALAEERHSRRHGQPHHR